MVLHNQFILINLHLLMFISASISGSSIPHVNFLIAKPNCADRCGNVPMGFTVNNTANKLIAIGCDTDASVFGFRIISREDQSNRRYQIGCRFTCSLKDDLADGSCTGLGCCQMSIPKQALRILVTLDSSNNFSNVWYFNNCSYGFVVEESSFTFSANSFSSLRKVERLPMVLDWAVGDGNCTESRKNISTYACKSANSECYDPDNGYGYRCYCEEGYEGNPYLDDGCKDIDECQNPSLHDGEKKCLNKLGSYECVCPEGYHGDGKKDGQGCIRGESLLLKLVAGIASGVSILLLVACWLYLELKRRKLIAMKQKLFLQNGGLFLQEQLIKKDKSTNTTKIFTSAELKKATNNFH